MWRALFGVELPPYGGVKSIDGDGDGACFGFCAFEADRDAVSTLFNTGASVAEMNELRSQPFYNGFEQHLLEIAAVYRKMRVLVTSVFTTRLSHNELAMPVEKGEFLSLNTIILQTRLKIKGGQNADRVRHHVDANPEWLKLWGCFINLAGDAAFM